MLLLFALIAGSSSAWAQTTIWSEDFSSYSADDVPTGGTYFYACANGKGTSPGTTKIYNQNTGGGTAPELMVGKKGTGDGAKGGSFTAVIPLDKYEGTLTLKYKQNAYGLKVTMTAGTATNNQTKSTKAEQTLTLTGVTTSMTSVTIVFEATSTSNVRLDDIVLTGTKASSVATPTFDPAGGAYTSTQSVTITCATDGSTIYYTTDGSTPTSSSTQYTSAISVSSTTTIKAIAKNGDDYSSVASATYTILDHAGTEADPYSVADARAAIDANMGISEVYATGIVSEIVETYNSEYKNITFNISADGLTTGAQLQAYRCKKGANDSDPDVAEIKVGDVVIVKGNLTKHEETYEFEQNNVLISLEHPTTPLITVTPTSLTDFTYEVGKGPSEAKTFSVEGSNLKANISLSLGGSNYEMSLTAGSGYTNSLTLTQTAGAVAATTIYVRLKADLALNASYNDNITLTSTDATAKEVSLAGSVTNPVQTWDLSIDETATATTTEMTWTSAQVTMRVDKGTATTATNSYYPSTPNQNYTSTRFYKNSILTITPVSGYSISSVVFTATTANYANALQGSTWTNAAASVDGTTVTVTPVAGLSAIIATIGGTCGFTAVKVYYESSTTSVTISEYKWATFVSDKALDFTGSDVKAYGVTGHSGNVLTLTSELTTVAANTPLLLNAAEGEHNINVVASGDDVDGNLLKAGTGAAISAEGGKTKYVLGIEGGKATFLKIDGTAATVSADKAYLEFDEEINAPVLSFDGEGTTGIKVIDNGQLTIDNYYNLAGQRVAQPTKGLYIVNGKKVVIK